MTDTALLVTDPDTAVREYLPASANFTGDRVETPELFVAGNVSALAPPWSVGATPASVAPAVVSAVTLSDAATFVVRLPVGDIARARLPRVVDGGGGGLGGGEVGGLGGGLGGGLLGGEGG